MPPKIFFVTPNLRSYLKEVASKSLYLPNPVDMDEIGHEEAPPRQVSKVLIFTRLDPIKGVDRIFPATEHISQNVQVTAFDWGPLAGDYVGKYGQWVTFVKPIPHAGVAAVPARGSTWSMGQMLQGSLGLMEIEALAAGRPVITGIDWTLYPEDPPPVIAASNADEIVISEVERLKNAPEHLAELSRKSRRMGSYETTATATTWSCSRRRTSVRKIRSRQRRQGRDGLLTFSWATARSLKSPGQPGSRTPRSCRSSSRASR